MRPLYALLRWLDGYTVGARNAPLAVETSVTEFRKLNDAARRYAERAESSFERQKQFIGNASHEMQTPLAVCRNRLEMLVDDAHALTGEQLGEIAKVQRTLDYLVRLNRSLLLLSKIDNGQFPEAEEVDVNALVRRTAEKRIRSRRRGRRGDGARRSASLHGLQQRCGRSARRRAYLRPVLSGNEEGGFYGAGPCRGRRSLPSLRVEGVLFL